MKHLEVAEIEFNESSGIIEDLLKLGHQDFHVFAGFGEEDSFFFLMKFPLQFLLDVARVPDEDSEQIFAHRNNQISVIDIGGGEFHSQHFSSEIGNEVHFQAKIRALGTSAETGQPFHCFVSVGVLEQADGNVGGIDVLHEMLILFVSFHNKDQHQHGEMIPSVQIDNQSFVGALEIEYPMN